MVVRTALAFVLMLALLWQSLALARPGLAVSAPADDGGHAALHWLEVAHHHHDDGTHHVDASSDSVQHLMADHAVASAALLPRGIDMLAAAPSRTAAPLSGHAGRPPFLDGPYKPPRRIA